MNKKCKIGFIGCGKMASAIIKGAISSKFVSEENIKGSEVNCDIAEAAQKRLGIEVLTDNKCLVIDSDVIFIATKPNYVVDVLDEIKEELTPDKLVVSIAAGVSTSKIENIIGRQRVIRVMPNTPALVLEGMSGICKGTYATDEDAEFVIQMLSSIGKCIEVSEDQMDIVTAISGSGPAFFYVPLAMMTMVGLLRGKTAKVETKVLNTFKSIMKKGSVDIKNTGATKEHFINNLLNDAFAGYKDNENIIGKLSDLMKRNVTEKMSFSEKVSNIFKKKADKKTTHSMLRAEAEELVTKLNKQKKLLCFAMP